MVALKEYLLSVTAAALLCGILGSLGSGKTFGGILKLICGTFLIFTVMAPLFQLNLQELSFPESLLPEDAQSRILEGVDYAEQARARIITQELAAYIQDKAAPLGAAVTAEFTLTQDEAPVPDEVRITGTWSGYAKNKLEQMLEEELGIPKEKQIWMHLQND